MEPKMSKANWWLRRALKFRSQRWRRRQVVFWSVLIGFWWLASIGAEHRGFHGVLHTLYPLMLGVPLGVNWRNQKTVVRSLEDRAQLEYGRSFDALEEDEKRDILERYQVGPRLVMRHQEGMNGSRWDWMKWRAGGRRRRRLRFCARRCWWCWRFIGWGMCGFRAGRAAEMDPRGWLDPVAWITGIVTLVFVLPNAVWMWRGAGCGE